MFLPLTTAERLARRPWATGAIILACTLVFVAMHTRFAEHLVGLAFTGFAQPAQLVTYTLLHASWFHLLSNMFFLWTFGRVLEARWGEVLFVLCFALCSAAGATLHGLVSRSVPGGLVGASGGIAGLAGALLVALPNARFNRLFSPLFWPATPIVALVRGRGLRALLDLLPVYGWVLKLDAGVPAFFVLPAWLSLDMFSMMLFPEDRTSYACHVGGAFAGIGIAVILRITRLPQFLERLGRPIHEVAGESQIAGGPALAPTVMKMRSQARASQWPQGRFSGAWFAISLLAAAGFMAGSARLRDSMIGLQKKRSADATRTKLLASRDPNLPSADATFEHALFSVVYPSFFELCAPGATSGPHCAQDVGSASPNGGWMELRHPEIPESVFVLAARGGADKRSDVVTSIANIVSGHGTKEELPWRLVEARNGTCHGEWSVESTIDVGEGAESVRMWSCTFTVERDLYFYAYSVPEVLLERDGRVLQKIVGQITLPSAKPKESESPKVSLVAALQAQAMAVRGGAPPAAPPPPGGGPASADTKKITCGKGELARRVDGKWQCYTPLSAAHR